MIQIATTTPDIVGFGNFEELAPHVFIDRATGQIVVDDGADQAMLIEITAE